MHITSYVTRENNKNELIKFMTLRLWNTTTDKREGITIMGTQFGAR